ncbi:MAG: DMT family transporter [Bermanella sp.]
MNQTLLNRTITANHTQQRASKSLEPILMLLAIGLAASSFPVAKYITHAMPATAMMSVRFLLAALLFAPFVFTKNRFCVPEPKRLLGYLLLSVPLVVFFVCMFESLRYTSVLNTGALYTCVPAVTAVYAFFINKEFTGRLRVGGLLMGTLGALWIVFKGDLNLFLSMSLNRGDGLFFIGCLLMGFYNPLVKRLYQGEPMEIMTFWVLFCGGVILFLFSFNDLANIHWLQMEMGVYGGIIYLSFFSTLVTFFIMQYCTVKVGATRVASYGFLTPVFVIFLSVFLGLDQFEWILMPGVFLVLVAMFIMQKEII